MQGSRRSLIWYFWPDASEDISVVTSWVPAPAVGKMVMLVTLKKWSEKTKSGDDKKSGAKI